MKARSSKHSTKFKIAGLCSVAAAWNGQAAVVQGGSSFTYSTTGSSQSWDIDGDSTTDFIIAGNSNNNGNIRIVPQGTGGALVGPTGTNGGYGAYLFKNLANAFQVGNTLAAGNTFRVGGYFGVDHPSGLMAFYSSFKGVGFPTSGGAGNYIGNIGFKFKTGGSTHYGWANVNFVSANPDTMTVNSWAYESTANTAITVGAVPEPVETGAALGLLAGGVAGLRRWRAARAAQSAAS